MNKMFGFLLTTAAVLCLVITTFADVRVKQKVTMGGQSFESTRSIKGSRERTEQRMETSDPRMADYFPQIANITQCDLKRTVRLNDRKQLYMVEPFQTGSDTSPVVRTSPEPTRTTSTRQGGTMTLTFTVKDTGERKMMFGLQARHLIITQEMESSADSCNGPMKTKIETDGWYVDFSADFNCPMAQPQAPPVATHMNKPDCLDRYVYKGNAAARTGFLLEGTMKMFAQDGSVQMTTMTETLELSRAPLDAALFDIPASYRQVNSSQDLFAISMPGSDETRRPRDDRPTPRNEEVVAPSRPAARSVAVNISLGSSAANQEEIENYIRGRIAARGLRPVPISGSYTLNIQFRQIKESTAGKIGGIFGKVTGAPTGSIGKVDIDMVATLSGGASREAKVKSKFDGPLSNAVREAVDQVLDELLSAIEN